MGDSADSEDNFPIDEEFDGENFEFHEQNFNFYNFTPIPTTERLKKWPEMYQVPRKCRKSQDFAEIRPAVGSVRIEFSKKPEIVAKPRIVVPCPNCDFVFGSGRALAQHQAKHSKTVKSEISTRQPGFLCPITDCTARCDYQATLNEHVRAQHENEQVAYETMQFANFNEFERWKENLEYSTSSRFVHTSGRYTTTGKTRRYSCFFTKSQQPTDKEPRGARNRPTKKLKRACTAHISVRETFGQIHVRACLFHCGHEHLVNNLPLSTIVRKEIATLLIRGETPEEIVEKLRKNSNSTDRRFYIRPYEIRNISAKIQKARERHGEQLEKFAVEEMDLETLTDVPPFVASEEIV
ncbi:C2H2-type domain-containing protein [Caenorhabditis elegans]|uniref:C2H2-type domain-containing protein n=1 Tax=Caenorhabditis elegans TaxID=6239 RepID=Q9N3M8_CAEEL|nr:C2H2-type domain-containing protein [Caenorhabditis elegans]CCD67075.1 C2H2-type domain-containing protein [Caenorhabditis elegans]|eukprot:NP_497502.2 Uncharacterized protein CELE_Y48G9A.11 [Caenorhabditis elegans]